MTIEDALSALIESDDDTLDLPNGLRVCRITPTDDDPNCWIVVDEGIAAEFPTALEAVRFALKVRAEK